MKAERRSRARMLIAPAAICLLSLLAGQSRALQSNTDASSAVAVDTTPPLQSGASAPPEIYTDRLIDERVAKETYEAQEALIEEPLGRRSFRAEYRYYQDDQDAFGTSYENGVLLYGRRETIDYGELEVEATLRHLNANELQDGEQSVAGLLRLQQYGFVINDSWLMDNAGGVFRTGADPLLTTSYRIHLPSSLIGGASSAVYSEDQSFRMSVGRIGRLGTTQVPAFKDTRGTLASIGYSRGFMPGWQGGMHFVNLSNDVIVPDHQSLAGVVQHESLDQNHRYQGHALTDSKGNYGLWFDGDDRFGSWRYRYGVFRLQPNLLWTDVPVTNDQQGGYFRSETRSLRYNLSAGIDYTETGIDADPDRDGIRIVSAFLSGTRFIRSRLNLGGTLNLFDTRPRSGSNRDENRNIRLTGFVSRRFPIGVSRLQLTLLDRLEGDDDGNGYGVIWDQDWEVSSTLVLSSELSHERSHGTGDDEERNSADFIIRHELTSRLRWNADMRFTRVQRNNRGRDDAYNASLWMDWLFAREWEASLRLLWNRLDTDIDTLADDDLSVKEKTLLLSIRRTFSSGQPIVALGRQTGNVGYGTIKGQVYLDENRDGRRQAGEPVAPGVIVILDDRYQRTTDRQGLFRFDPVSAGEHSLSIAIEDLPLPWGVADERPRPIKVPVREEVNVDFGLTRIDE